MLDENLPIFYFAESSDGVKHHETFLSSRGGSDPTPAYSLRHADPALSNSKNCYAVALFDAYNHDVLFGEVLIRPKWTHPTLSADEIRRNGGVAPPPEPIMPSTFVVQLYNPELQILVARETGLLGSTHYDFSMPQDTFRMPSGSMLDRTQNDPGASQTTPRINFSMKKEGKLSKDFMLYVKGKSTDVVHKKKSKEPDIAVAMFRSLREVTVLESNLYRVEMEDAKGLEVVILLVSTVIRDVFYGQMNQAFNVSGAGGRRRSSGAKLSPTSSRPGAAAGQFTMSGGAGPAQGAGRDGPITDPRTQWELDNETQRLKRQAEEEARQERRHSEIRRREREKADEEEARRLQKQIEEEERAARRRQTEVDQETARLQKLYGVRPVPNQAATRPQAHSAPVQQGPFPNAPPPAQNSNLSTYPQYPQPPPSQSQSQSAPYYPPYNPQAQYQQQQQQQQQPHLPPRPQQQQPYQQYPPQPQPQSHQSQQHAPRPSSSVLHPQSSAGLSALGMGASVSQFFSSHDRRKQKSSRDLQRDSDSGGRLHKKTSSVF